MDKIKLHKSLSLFEVICIAAGSMLTGMFLLPGIGFAVGGPSLLVAYLLAGFLAIMGMLSQAELASAMPKAGGDYYYVTRSLGSGVGTIYGLITWFSLSLKAAYELSFISVIIALTISDTLGFGLNAKILALIMALGFIIININGVKKAGKIQVILVVWIVINLLFYIIIGLRKIDVANFSPFIPSGQNGMVLFSTAAFIFVSFGGLLKVASLAEEVKNPGETLPRAMITVVILNLSLYLLINFVTIGVIQGSLLSGNKSPLSTGALITIGRWGEVLFSICAVAAIFSSVNANMLSASRYPFALARDRMLPHTIGNVSNKFHTPYISILLTGIIIIVAIFTNPEKLVKTASSVLILTYIFACLGVVVLRESKLQNYRPLFRAPLYPFFQILGVLGLSFLLYQNGKEALLISSWLFFAGFIIYFFYGRARARREYALLHIIERITARELTSHSLESELKEVVQERDEVSKDRFDFLIESCDILDIPQSLTWEEMFRIAAEKISPVVDMPAENIEKMLNDREKTTSTVLTPFLAVPHIILEGNGKFDILLVRCREGVVFSEEKSKVHALFFLLGTMDERQFHLRALASIAQIVHDPKFEKRWLSAKNIEVLRDVILLGKRSRHN